MSHEGQILIYLIFYKILTYGTLIFLPRLFKIQIQIFKLPKSIFIFTIYAYLQYKTVYF